MPAAAAVALLAACAAAAAPPPPLPTANLTSLLVEIADWIMTTDVGSNNLNNATFWEPVDAIFVNGNLARVLLAAHKITGNASYLGEGLRWCDSFVALQQPITTGWQYPGGYWDTGYNDMYFGDSGTAVTTLAVCHSVADAGRQATYEGAMTRFAAFVTQGCLHAPPKYSPNDSCPPGRGWVIPDGAAAGAMGDGWIDGELNLAPYTVSTATTGCAFAEMAAAGVPGADAATAERAVAWILSTRRDDGTVPYIITPADPTPTLYQPITYSAEAFVDVDLRWGDRPGVHDNLASTLNATVRWLVQNQSADGGWGVWNTTAGGLGFDLRGDAQRSPRALSLLQWYYQRVDPEPAVAAAIQRYVTFVTDPATRAGFGIGPPNWRALPAGFVGLAVADLISPWVTFRPLDASRAREYVLGPSPLA